MPFQYEKNTSRDDHGEITIFESYLRDRGLKLTSARKELLDVIFSDHSHFTAEDLFDRCRERTIRVSKATLYRTLTILLDCKLLAAHDFGEGSRYYEHIYGHRHHDHFFCMVCKGITEFRCERIERLQDEAAVEIGFVPIQHNLAIFGVCEGCSQTPRGRQLAAEYAAIQERNAPKAENA